MPIFFLLNVMNTYSYIISESLCLRKTEKDKNGPTCPKSEALPINVLWRWVSGSQLHLFDACICLFFLMCLCLCLPVAMVALEWLRSSVFAVVSCQLITSGKTPFAALPWALIGLLTWETEREREEKVSHFIIISTSNFPRLSYSCSLTHRFTPSAFINTCTPPLFTHRAQGPGRQTFQWANTLN